MALDTHKMGVSAKRIIVSLPYFEESLASGLYTVYSQGTVKSLSYSILFADILMVVLWAVRMWVLTA